MKYVGEKHANHLVTSLKEHYTISQYWEGKIYLRMDLEWDYKKQEVHISILDYIAEALILFQHIPPKNRKTNRIHT